MARGGYGERYEIDACWRKRRSWGQRRAPMCAHPSKRATIDRCAGSAGPRRAEALGYHGVHVLRDGTAAWQRAGYTLYEGVNVPSKTFGELVENERHTP